MKLGVFSLTDIYPGSPDTAASRIDDIVGYGILAEQSGLDVFGIGEHHTRAFAVSSPAVVHAAIARATSRITLTTTATVLSVLDPVRVYQDFATLDLVSHGRAEIIAGRSAFAEPFALFGEDIAQLDDLFAEKLDLLLRLRNEDRVTWTGRFRPPRRGRPPTRTRSARCRSGSPSAAPPPAPCVPAGSAYRWRSASSVAPTMANLAARRGALMVGGPTQVAEKILDLHAELGVDRSSARSTSAACRTRWSATPSNDSATSSPPPSATSTPRAATPARMNVTVFGATGAIGSL